MKKQTTLFSILLFFLSAWSCFSTTTANAPEGNNFKFKQSGPGGGGACMSLAFDPNDENTIWVGSDVGGIFVSHDNGATFTSKNFNMPDYWISKILVNPDDSNIILAATLSGVARSTDGGDTWTLCRSGFPATQTGHYSAPVNAIAWGPDPDTMYAAVGLIPFKAQSCTDGNRGLIYRSVNNGTSWTQKSALPIPADANFQDIRVRPDDNWLVLAASDKGLFRSADGGDSWVKITSALAHDYVQHIAFSSSTTNIAYLLLRTTCPNGGTFNGGIYRSTDVGNTWIAKAGNGLPRVVAAVGQSSSYTSQYYSIEVDPNDSQTVYVSVSSYGSWGIYKSTDGGDNFTYITRRTGNVNMDPSWITGCYVYAFALDYVNTGRMMMGSNQSIWKTEDGGTSWQYYNSTFTGMTDSGARYFTSNGWEITFPRDIVFDPVSFGRMYFCFEDCGLLLSQDHGKTYRECLTSPVADVYTLVKDPANTHCWMAYGSPYYTIYKTTDSALLPANWSSSGSGLPASSDSPRIYQVALDLSSTAGNRILYATVNATTASNDGLYKSTDDGASWTKLSGSGGLPANVRPIDIHVNGSEVLVLLWGNAAANGGLYKTTNGGTSWSHINTDNKFYNTYDMDVSPADPNTIFIAQKAYSSYYGGVFKSTDGGVSFTRTLEGNYISSVKVNPNQPNIVYAGTADAPYHDNCTGEGLFRSEDGGQNWTMENAGLPFKSINNINVDPFDPAKISLAFPCSGFALGYDADLMIGYWTFDESSGDAADSGSNSNDASVYGAIYSSGKFNNCLSFDGSNDYAMAPYDSSLDAAGNKLSISVWVKLSELKSQRIIDRASATTRQNYYLCMLNSGGYKIVGGTYNNGAQCYQYSTKVFTADDLNQWVYVVFTDDGQYTRMYINGAASGSTSWSAHTIGNDSTPLYIGTTKGTSNFLHGYIDDMRIYNCVLSQQQIQAMYNQNY